MSDLDVISNLLAQSVNAATAKSAEKQLKEIENQQGFPLTLLNIVQSTNLPLGTRLAAALFFKNFIKRKWVDEDGNYLNYDSDAIKAQVVDIMISLPNNLQAQIGESISLIADSDFPMRWPTLVPDLVSKLSNDDMVTNKGVLTVAHSIFKRWRALFRSDDLFLEIQMVLDLFSVPFLQLFQSVDEQITANSNNQAKLTLLFDVFLVLVKLYYDLNCQDIPEFFEDNMKKGMGIVHKYLGYNNPLMEDESDDDNASIVLMVKSSIQELVQLYTTRYEDVFSSMINDFIQTTWELLTNLAPKAKNDVLVCKSMEFLSSVSRIPAYFEHFNSETSMNTLITQIILPNLTLHDSDEELFEDDPIEYIRRDLEGSDLDTRRRACTDLLKVLKEKNKQLVTTISLQHIESFLTKYNENQAENWKYKDLAIYFFLAIAVEGNVTHHGVSNVNEYVDVMQFFSTNILQHLNGSNTQNPIINVDAIKYVYTFRNQLNKEQLVEILPYLASFLQNANYVVYTYAAITIERILSMRVSPTSSKFIFQKEDLAGSAELLLTNLFELILKDASSPEKLSENEFLMKSIYKILSIAEDVIQNSALRILSQLFEIVTITMKNPANPRFSHFTFEAIGVIIRFNCRNSVLEVVDQMMPTMLQILAEDVQEFVPYAFQIISYCLEILPDTVEVPQSISQLSVPLLTPSVWEYKGNIPAVTRFLKNLIKKNHQIYPDLIPVLGIFQRLISSKILDVHAFELLEYLVNFVPVERLEPFLKEIMVLILQRLQNSKTEKYVKRVIVFLGNVSIIKNSDFVVQLFDNVQDGLFQQIWNNFVLKTLPTIGNLLDRKIALVGLFNVILSSSLFSTKYSSLIVPSLDVFIDFTVSESVVNMRADDMDMESLEEITTFGSSYSKLISIADKPFDPIPQIDYIDGVKAAVSELLVKSNSLLISFHPQLSENARKGLIELGIS
ncbi:hypothetical protein ACO0QE_000907 [Hanseniaspora vineae]